MKKMKQGFTLVEIMIVVAIIGLLAAIAIPSFVKSRNTARTNACINNLRQIDSGKEQLAGLKDFGGGVYAANFTIDEPGKWGVISLFKNGEGQHTVKFWYPHTDM